MKGLLRRMYRWCGEPTWAARAYHRLTGGGHTYVDYAPPAWIDGVASWCGGLTGKRVLEVGADPAGRMLHQIFRRHRPAEAVGINLIARPLQIAPACKVEPGDIRKTAYPDDYFDVIVSSSAFEHVSNFDVAVAEMHRILKPGGHLFSHFGPIWSTSCGHHLWVVHQGKEYTYWNLVLPPYCHLLMTQPQLADELAKAHSPEFSRLVAEYVFTSPEQNQLFYEDYERILTQSPFEVIVFKGYDDWDLNARYNVSITPETFRALREKYPGRWHFSYEGITVLLAKRKKVGG